MSGVSKATTSVPYFQRHDVTSKLRLNPKAAQGFLPGDYMPKQWEPEVLLMKR